MPPRTARLRLIGATPSLAQADLAGAAALAAALGAEVAADWPPELYGAAEIRWGLAHLLADPRQDGWAWYYLVRDDLPRPVAVGVAGFTGRPADDGTVELGYSILTDHRCQGLASEAVAALIARAFDHPAVTRVIAETYPHLAPSLRVMEKNGLEYDGPGSAPEVVRYALARARYAALPAGDPALAQIGRLLGHLAWADRKALDALRATPDPAALQLMSHVLAAEALWLARLEGRPAPVAVWPELDLAGCAALARETHAGLSALLRRLGPSDRRRDVAYRTSAGVAFVSTVEDILLHVCLHGGYHRGQIARCLRLSGGPPAETDYIGWARGAAAARQDPAPSVPGRT